MMVIDTQARMDDDLSNLGFLSVFYNMVLKLTIEPICIRPSLHFALWPLRISCEKKVSLYIFFTASIDYYQ